MPAFGRDGVLKREEILAVASHVRELAGLSTEPKADLKLGRKGSNRYLKSHLIVALACASVCNRISFMSIRSFHESSS